MSQQDLFAESSNGAPTTEPFVCSGCGFNKFVDEKIHGGQTTRRDCARCKLTVGFPIWYGATVDLPHHPRRHGRGLLVNPRIDAGRGTR